MGIMVIFLIMGNAGLISSTVSAQKPLNPIDPEHEALT